MPIIEQVAPDTPLTQGDILKGVSLFSTRKAWENGGESVKSQAQLCLVVSRPCLALHGEWVTVTAIERYKNRPPEFSSFDRAQTFYKEIRDGLTAPDNFYLGQIGGFEGSCCARFDSFHKIQLPKDGTDERAAFVREHRIGRLHTDFAHDVHLRLFRAFASLGFDDHRWFPNADLQVLVTIAEKELASKKAELLGVQQKLQLGQSQGFHNEDQKKSLEKEEACLKEALEAMADAAQPYRDELTRRGAG
jgi:hypothetical protein